MEKKISKKDIIDLILEILELESREMNIRQIKVKLERDYNIKKSQQTIKNYIKYLEKKGKIKIEK